MLWAPLLIASFIQLTVYVSRSNMFFIIPIDFNLSKLTSITFFHVYHTILKYKINRLRNLALYKINDIILTMQIWFIGRTPASQAGKAGSIPVICFFYCQKKCRSLDTFEAGDERIELPPKVLETPIIPFDQSPIFYKNDV